MQIHPRNDIVLVKEIVVETLGRLAVSQKSAQGKRFRVEAVGPDVEGLQEGDYVIIAGGQAKENIDWARLPQDSTLIACKQEAIWLTYDLEEAADEDEPAA